MPTASFEPSRPVRVAKPIPIGGDKTIPVGTLWDWQKAGVKEDRVEKLHKQGYLKHTDATPPRVTRRQIAAKKKPTKKR